MQEDKKNIGGDNEDIVLPSENPSSQETKKTKKEKSWKKDNLDSSGPTEADLVLEDENVMPTSSQRSKRSSSSSKKKRSKGDAAVEPGAVPHSPKKSKRKSRRHQRTEEDGGGDDALPSKPRRKDSSKKTTVLDADIEVSDPTIPATLLNPETSPSSDLLDLTLDGGPVCAVPIDEEAYRQELLQQAKDEEAGKTDGDGTARQPVLAHAVKAPIDDSVAQAKQRKDRCMRRMICIAIGLVLLLALVIGLAVGLQKDPEMVELEAPRTFNDFCKLMVGFYAIQEPRMRCMCEPSTNTVECAGDYDYFYSGVTIEFHSETGAYAGVECQCSSSNCPSESSYVCYTVFSEDACEITDTFGQPNSETICGEECSMCDNDSYYSLNIENCANATSNCYYTLIPKPQFLYDFVGKDLPATPTVVQHSSFGEFCNKTVAEMEAKGYVCFCEDNWEEVENNQGEAAQSVGCSFGDAVILWIYEESSIGGIECDCWGADCDFDASCTMVLHDFVSGHATCQTTNSNLDEILCGGAECTVCEQVGGESIFRVDTSDCDGSQRCRATDLVF